MKYIFVIFIAILCISAVVIIGFDFVMNFVSQMKRYRIGRWKDEEQWKDAVKKRCYKWMKRTPTVKKTDNYRYLLLDIVRGNYRNATIQSWQTAGLVLGVNEIEDEESQAVIKQWKEKILTKDGQWRQLGNKVDYALLAYALLKATEDVQSIKPAMDCVVKILENNLCEDGMVSYSQGKDTCIRFVDTLGMVCSFLTAYGVVYQKDKYVDMAMRQIEAYREVGLLRNSALPCHACNVNTRKPLGIYGWGRGAAWYFLALVNTWKELPHSDNKEKVEQWILEAANCYIQYQQPDGGFCTILQGGGQYDSSVTAAMSYFYRMCWEIFGEKKFLKVSDKCLMKVKTVTMRNGAIDVCQGDTHGIGVFSQVFDIMPFAQGLVMQTLEMKTEET